MTFQFILNLIIAVTWMLINESRDAVSLLIGYLIGLVFIFALRRFFPGPFYLQKGFAVVKLLLLFMKELVLSNITVIREILRPRLVVRPGIVAVPTDLKSDGEITMLACLITLTPGTLTLEVSPDQRTLYIHAMDISDADELAKQIKSSFEKAIMEVTR
ncbi:Na+/H+ antiporter subunit E [Paenibacillus turpanensis]|uniref:Na+/H+ antiporter subunit E n=1 Tax=Paenibacillus turpanensis TaxID=2689078 RepID=UPI00140AAB97|nr:Na+/H+ antiporter subunit E [Paenibacillus turpanensis]